MTYTIIYIGAKWCAPCKVIKPAVQDLSKKFQIPMTIKDYDDDLTDEERETVSKLPSLRIYNDTNILVVEFLDDKVAKLTEWLQTNMLTPTDDF
jgi:thiol-disulfide isomerase/thioredoxin